MNLISLKKGCLLVAEVALTGDASFSRSIVFLAEHNEEGSVGFILNKAIDYKLSDLLPEIETDFNLYKGGPVEQDSLYYLHKIPERLPGSIEIGNGLFWGGDFRELYKALKTGTIAEDDIKFFLGYSGWAPGQLDFEIDAQSWIIMKNEYQILQTTHHSMWKENLKKLGGKYIIWANSPEDPSYN